MPDKDKQMGETKTKLTAEVRVGLCRRMTSPTVYRYEPHLIRRQFTEIRREMSVETRRKAFEQAAEHATELARKSMGLSRAPYREACAELAGWCLDRALAKEPSSHAQP